MHGCEESDGCIVPLKPPNKAERRRRGWREGARSRGTWVAKHAPDTGPGDDVSQASPRVGDGTAPGAARGAAAIDPSPEPGAGKTHAGNCTAGAG